MKISLPLAFLFLGAVLLHAEERQGPNTFNFGLTCLIAVSDNHVSPGTGLAVAWYNPALFGAVGLGAIGHIVMPIVSNYGNYDGTRVGFAASLLAGASFMLFDNGAFALPFTAGFHINYVTPQEFNWHHMNMGIGVNTDFLWRFAARWHAYARLTAIYNFGAGGEFLAFPGIGVGFSF